MDFLKLHFQELQLGGETSNVFLFFTPKLGEMIQFDEHIFQMGWNHQLDSPCDSSRDLLIPQLEVTYIRPFPRVTNITIPKRAQTRRMARVVTSN